MSRKYFEFSIATALFVLLSALFFQCGNQSTGDDDMGDDDIGDDDIFDDDTSADDDAPDDDAIDDDIADDGDDTYIDDDVVDDDSADDDTADDDTASAPLIPNTHDTSWNCYICHEGQHGGIYNAPSDCLTCHATGGPPNPPQGPGLPGGHNPSSNCKNCHANPAGHASDPHYNDYIAPGMCLVCHQ